MTSLLLPKTTPSDQTTDDPLSLTQLQEAELLRLIRAYRREFNKCASGGAHLAACALAGATLEAMLILTVNAFCDEVAAIQKLPQRKGQTKPLLAWTLPELLQVAKAVGWLPSGLECDEKWNSRRAKVGDYAEVVRELRNLLLHPARYIEDYSRRHITKRHLCFVEETLDAVSDVILRKLYTRINIKMDEAKKLESEVI